MRILLLPFGSAGDVHPLVGIGKRLRARGHRVIVITNELFGPLVTGEGLEFVELGSARAFRTAAADPLIWHPRRGFEVIARTGVIPALRPMYELVTELYRPGDTVVGAASLAFGARIAQEKLGLPLATLHLQPAVFQSAVDPPTLPGAGFLRLLPRWLRRGLFHLANRAVLDPVLSQAVNGFRAELGLPPARDFLRVWWHSPQRVIGLFPDWYAPKASDWPPNTVLTGFPLYDGGALDAMPDDVARFLDAGDPPVVITPGSANVHARAFFAAAAEACAQLGLRALLLTPETAQTPRPLPEAMLHAPYAPFGALLPRAAALVHHGGIGSAAQAMRAGIPQLVMPSNYDQPDNAVRLARFGVGVALPPRWFTAGSVARALRRLLASPAVAAQCRAVAARFAGADPIDKTCDLLEQLASA